DRVARQDGEAHVGMLSAIRRGDHRHHGERRRDGGNADMSGEAMLERVDLLAHGTRVADDAARPVEHALALRRESLKARTALHQKHAEHVLELLDACRKGWLAHTASLGRVAEMALARERNDEFEFVEHEGALAASAIFARTGLKGQSARRHWPWALSRVCIISISTAPW